VGGAASAVAEIDTPVHGVTASRCLRFCLRSRARCCSCKQSCTASAHRVAVDSSVCPPTDRSRRYWMVRWPLVATPISKVGSRESGRVRLLRHPPAWKVREQWRSTPGANRSAPQERVRFLHLPPTGIMSRRPTADHRSRRSGRPRCDARFARRDRRARTASGRRGMHACPPTPR
jgi:hypothetical protein